MRLLAILLCALLLATQAAAQSLIIQAANTESTDNTTCFEIDFSPFVPISGRILAAPYLASSAGIHGAEFRIPLPAGIIVQQLVPGPGVDVLAGSPFADPTLGGGVLVSVTPCGSATYSEPVVLFDFTLLSLSVDGPVALEILKRSNATNPSFDCPTVLDCSSVNSCATQGYRSVTTPPHSPFPADGAANVPLDVVLTWQTGFLQNCGCTGLPSTATYFGTDPNPPGVPAGIELYESYDPGGLASGTTYYWRISNAYCDEPASSPVWSFTTTGPVGVESTTWSRIRVLYR